MFEKLAIILSGDDTEADEFTVEVIQLQCHW